MPRTFRRLPLKGGKKQKGNGWREGTDQNVKALGKFGEHLVQHILGGVRSEDCNGDCDLWLDELDVGLESKVGSNREGVRVRIEQLDSHLQLVSAGFPFSHYWYVFLKYQNWGRNGNGQRCRLFQEMVHSESEVPNFLGKNTVGLYILDISVVSALRDKQEKTVTVWHNRGTSPAVLISWRFFEQLRNQPAEVFRGLSLDFGNYQLDSKQIQTMFAGHRMEFEFLALLRADLSPKRVKGLFQLEKEGVISI